MGRTLNKTLFVKIGLVRPGLACQAGPGRAQPSGPGLTEGLSMRIGADLHENRLFIEKRCCRPILIISGPSRPQKWIRLEISGRMVVSGGLEVKIEPISWSQSGYSQFVISQLAKIATL